MVFGSCSKLFVLVCALELIVILAQDLFLAAGPKEGQQKPSQGVHQLRKSLIAAKKEVAHSGHQDPSLETKHVLWPASLPKPGKGDYHSWYSSSNITWVSESSLPQVDPSARVDVFYLTKPVFSLVGRASGIWHGGIGFRVEGGPSLMFEYTSIDFKGAIAYPDTGKTSINGTLHWPSTAIVDYHIDNTGKTFPVTGPDWKITEAVGETNGTGVNLFVAWAFKYAIDHPRYLVWRVLEPNTEQTLIESQQCFDFVFQGYQYLQNMGLGTINATQLTRTIVNVYATGIKSFPFDAFVTEFFSSERKVMEEWLELSGEIPTPWRHSSVWYWPAWYSTTPYLGGNSHILQNVEYPIFYHKYMLAWPKITKSKSTAEGVQRTEMPVFRTTLPMLL